LVEEPHHLWMAMEFVSGGSLEDLLKREVRLSIDETVRLGIQMSDALAYAHQRDIVHRDFKPANVLIDEAGNSKVTDFGLAKLLQGPKLTQVGAVLGSPTYMSPEQVTGGQIDVRTDIYAFGISLYELLTGNPPFVGDTTTVLTQHITSQPTCLRDRDKNIPEDLDDLVMSMLIKDPAQRIGDMAIALKRLRALQLNN